MKIRKLVMVTLVIFSLLIPVIGAEAVSSEPIKAHRSVLQSRGGRGEKKTMDNSSEPIKAYRSVTSVPTIDGSDEPHEWGFAYTFSDDSIHSECTMEHDEDHLYIRVYVGKVQNESFDKKLLLIHTKESRDKAIGIFTNESTRLVNIEDSNITVEWDSDPDVTAACNYTEEHVVENPRADYTEPNQYIFEIKMDLSYLNVTNKRAPFDLEYTENFEKGVGSDNSISLSEDGPDDIRDELYLSSDSDEIKTGLKTGLWPPTLPTLVVMIGLPITIVVIAFYIFRRKGERETKESV